MNDNLVKMWFCNQDASELRISHDHVQVVTQSGSSDVMTKMI